MRFITGLVAGVLLTIGTAYVVDAMHGGAEGDARERPQMVNWTVVDANLRGLTSNVQAGWHRLVSDSREMDRKSGI